jgi:hypothetical protein
MLISSLPQSNRPWSIAIRNAHQKLHQIYCTGYSYVNSGSVEVHRLQQYGQAIISEAYPLLLLLSETAESEGVPTQWIDQVSTDFTALLALIDEAWTSSKDECVQSDLFRSNLIFDLDLQMEFVFHNLSIRQQIQEIEADQEKVLIPRFFMKPFRKEDGFPLQFLQVYSALIEKPFKHGKRSWELFLTLIRSVMQNLTTWFAFTTKKTQPEDALTSWGISVRHIHYEFKDTVLLLLLIVLTS